MLYISLKEISTGLGAHAGTHAGLHTDRRVKNAKSFNSYVVIMAGEH